MSQVAYQAAAKALYLGTPAFLDPGLVHRMVDAALAAHDTVISYRPADQVRPKGIVPWSRRGVRPRITARTWRDKSGAITITGAFPQVELLDISFYVNRLPLPAVLGLRAWPTS
ncbi:hypothetical protein [Nonomuraea candida]|uniref:hypothetical protein n=1 Tax=Nonomuraea candida TaxID=359159 RepID=UPI0005BE0DA5|nr:hypothetical protein [Nonomuraea candida]